MTFLHLAGMSIPMMARKLAPTLVMKTTIVRFFRIVRMSQSYQVSMSDHFAVPSRNGTKSRNPSKEAFATTSSDAIKLETAS